MESFAPYVETYPVQWDIMYLHLALGCDFPILEAYSKAVYNRKHLDPWEVKNLLGVPYAINLRTACIHLKHNQIHRIEGPAVVFDDGSYIWCFQDKVSRTNGPALVFQNLYMEWRVNDMMHRMDGPARSYANEILNEWRFESRFHRKDGPALEYGQTLEQLRKDRHFNPTNDPSRSWKIQFYIHGLQHREHPLAASIQYNGTDTCYVAFWNKGRQTNRIEVSEYSELEPYL